MTSGNTRRQFVEAQEKAAVLLPIELWVEVKGVFDEMSDAIGEFDSQGIIEQGRMKTLISRMAKVALLSRVVIGFDELTEQSIELFSSQKEYVRVANLEIAYFAEIQSRRSR